MAGTSWAQGPAVVRRRPSAHAVDSISPDAVDAPRFRRPRSIGRCRSRGPRRRRSCCGPSARARRAAKVAGGRSAVSCSTSRAEVAAREAAAPGPSFIGLGTRRSSNGNIRTRPSVIGRGGRRSASRERTGSSSRSTRHADPGCRSCPPRLSSCSSLASVMSRSSAGRACRRHPSPPATAPHWRDSQHSHPRAPVLLEPDLAAPVEPDIAAPGVARSRDRWGPAAAARLGSVAGSLAVPTARPVPPLPTCRRSGPNRRAAIPDGSA